jgi:hypothetical protein
MRLADIVTAGMPALCQQYQLNPYQYRALSAITDCRTGALGSTVMHCLDCDTRQIRHRSCSHRSCPQCQHHSNGAWFERQRGKRLPANYFMVTFTLPAQIRPLAYANPKQVYNALFQTALSTLSTFAHNHPQLQGQIGACAVLHTHARKLNYHPHVHVIVPAIAVNPARKQFRRLKGDYLFKGSNLAEVFRARMLEQLNQMKLDIPAAMPAQWNVNCVFVGKGLPALEYLSRYLYRGVISERDIVHYDQDTVTFRYREANSGIFRLQTLPIADFLWRIVMQVLPKGFRRVRDYGFLHANASSRLLLLQLLMNESVSPGTGNERPATPFICQRCRQPMRPGRLIPPG